MFWGIMKLTLIRQINSCCTLNFFYKTDAPINLEVFARSFPLNEAYKSRGYAFVDNNEYMIYSVIGSNEIKIVAKNKSFDISSIVSKIETI